MYDFIKDRLKEIGKKQKDLADFINIKPPHLSAIFSGIRQIQASELPLMAQFLQYDIDTFMLLISGKDVQSTRKTINKIGYVQAGIFTESVELPQSEWEQVYYTAPEVLQNKRVFALGVKGNSMNKIFLPEKTTLICLNLEDFYSLEPTGIKNGDFVIAQRKTVDGLYESTVKRYNKLSDGTVILEAMSTDLKYNNIVIGQDDAEYKIIAIVVDYQIKIKDL